MPHMKTPCVYILASKPKGTLYIGVTSDLAQRVWQHKNDFVEGFTKRYRLHRLVWYEAHESMYGAVTSSPSEDYWSRLAGQPDLAGESHPGTGWVCEC